ncbi:MAG: ribonuclease J [Alphaproteobacteria bacterium]|nr:ribonuclease J [Alphaproteobacteria bacterium]
MTFNFAKYKDQLLFVPLGGSNEIGMNLNLYTIGGKWLMVDCGIGFASDALPGIDVIVPDISFIQEIKNDLLGLVITHAHEDHLGAVPYLWREMECPIYATPFTACFLKHKLSEMGPGKQPKVHEMAVGSTVDIGPFALELVELTHSIPEMQAIAITTEKGVVMHTGDWKFDENPMVGPVSDYDALKRYGDGNVLAMVCDSTNVFVEGTSGSEGEVREHLTALIKSCKQRVIVSTFASNLARVQTLIMAAHESGRVVALAGRSLFRVVQAAQESGYLPEDLEFINDKEVMNLPREDVLLICTGCQGEPRAALPRIARGDHPNIRLLPGDTVIMSSRKIPGNEMKINAVNNRLAERGVEVITDKDFFIHVSGHPARDELKRMYELVRPRIAIPTHGERRHLHEHAKLARQWGAKKAVEAHNGAVVLLDADEASVVGTVHSGYIAIDGSSLIPTDGDVIRTRRKLRDDGCILISAVVNLKGELLFPVQLSAPGIFDIQEDKEFISECIAEASEAIAKCKKGSADSQLREAARLSIRQLIKREIDKKPVIEVHIARV